MISGLTYRFKVQARNMFGLSPYTSETVINVGSRPDQPLSPSTTVVGSNVVVAWSAPNSNGSPITSYRISLRQADLTFS